MIQNCSTKSKRSWNHRAETTRLGHASRAWNVHSWVPKTLARLGEIEQPNRSVTQKGKSIRYKKMTLCPSQWFQAPAISTPTLQVKTPITVIQSIVLLACQSLFQSAEQLWYFMKRLLWHGEITLTHLAQLNPIPLFLWRYLISAENLLLQYPVQRARTIHNQTQHTIATTNVSIVLTIHCPCSACPYIDCVSDDTRRQNWTLVLAGFLSCSFNSKS